MATPEEFARLYGPAAARAGEALGVAPAVLLGQFGLETGWGKSVVPGTNNLGNIKDFSGSGVAATDNMTGSRDRYRQYESPEAFFDDYVSLIQRKYPAAVGAGDDAEKFGRALKFGGYAEDPAYVPKVASAAGMVRNLGDKLAEFLIPAAQAGTAPAGKIDPALVKWDDDVIDPAQVVWDEPEVAAADAEAPTATAEQRIVASAPMRAIKGGKDVLDAGAQMLAHAVPSGVADAVNDATRYVNELPILGPVTKALGMTPASAQELDQQLASDERQYQAARAATGQTGFDGARLLGGIAATAPLTAAMPAAAATLPGRVAAGAAGGTAFGLLNPVTDGEYGAEKAKQAAIGAASGGALSAVGAGLGRMLAPRAAQNPQVRALLNEGITPTPGQIVGGTAQRIEDKLMSVPVVGDAIQTARRRGQEEFNRAALNRAVAPIGGRVTAVGREGMQQVDSAISAAYDGLLPRLTFRADAQFGREIGRLQQMVATLPEQQARQFESIVRSQVASRLTPQGAATGQHFKLIESEIGRLARTYGGSSVAGERSLGAALGELQTSLRGALSRSNPHLAPELGRINQAYANYVRLQRAAGGAGAESGVFTPAQLSAAVRGADSSVRKGRFARGEALMQDLSDAGKAVMGSKVPNSGTADRLFNLGALGATVVNPTTPLLLGAAAIPYLSGANRVAASLLARRPEGVMRAGTSLERYAPGIAAIFGLPVAGQN